MTRARRLVVVLVALALQMAMAATSAGRPLCPDHPSCGDDPVDDQPIAGTTCEAIGEWGDPVSDAFTVTLTENACIDVIATEGVWSVEIGEISGSMRWLSFVIRDSVAPGDACDSVFYRRDIPSQVTLDGPESDNNPGIAGAWVNSCGTGYAEWVGDTYYADEDPSISSPLVFQVFMGGKDVEVTLDVTLP